MEANQVRYDLASVKYGREIVRPRFSDEGLPTTPFNETPAWNTPLGKKHWFEIPLACGKVRRDTGLDISGRFFTTAMPRKVDHQWPELDGNGNYPTWLTDPSQEDVNASRQVFKSKASEFQIRNVFVFGSDKELEAAGSKRLFEFYAALGLRIVHCPTQDFNCPNPDACKKAIELLTLSLVNGRNTTAHCWGGSGRTGVYVACLLKNLGVKDPLEWARQVGKSVYVDVAEQEQFISQMKLHITQRMVQSNRDMVVAMLQSHDQRLADAGDPKNECELDDATIEALTGVRDLIKNMSRSVPLCTPMTAPDRAHMEAGSGEVGDYPLPSPEGDAERQPTPLAVEGDYWSNMCEGHCVMVQPLGSKDSVEECSLWS